MIGDTTPGSDRHDGARQRASAQSALAMLRLASTSLPIGGFSYSQGLEPAIVADWVSDERSLANWLCAVIEGPFGHYEAPLCARLFTALDQQNIDAAIHWHDDYLASRETSELRAETLQMGYSLLKMLVGVEDGTDWVMRLAKQRLAGRIETALPLAYGMAANAFNINSSAALQAYSWAWLDNQIAAAIKAIPLGQQAGQRIMDMCLPVLAAALTEAPDRLESEWSNFAPGLAMASSWHETQYSRLFRS